MSDAPQRSRRHGALRFQKTKDVRNTRSSRRREAACFEAIQRKEPAVQKPAPGVADRSTPG